MASTGSECSDERTLNDFKMWSEEAIKHFLSVRKKNVEGDTETLIYRAMTAYEEKIPIDEEAEKVFLLSTKTNLL